MRQALAASKSGEAGATPLSPPQQLLWAFERLKPGTALYSIPMATRLTGPLDVDALERAVSEVVQRHDVLRATIEDTPEGPVHRVRDAPASPLDSRPSKLPTSLRMKGQDSTPRFYPIPRIRQT